MGNKKEVKTGEVCAIRHKYFQISLGNIVHESPDTELYYIRNIHECQKSLLLLVRPYLSIFRVQQFEQCLRAIFTYLFSISL